MYHSQRLMVDWLNARNKGLNDEINSLKRQLDTACAEAHTHANAVLAARTSAVAATNERSALKRHIWELQDQCTQLRVEASKPTPCSPPHGISRPRTNSQATVDAATMTEPPQSDTIVTPPTPPATPQPQPQPIFPRYYTGDTLVYPGVETATSETATKTAAATKAAAKKVAKAVKRATNAALQPTPLPEQLLIFSRYYTGDMLVYPGVKTAPATKAMAGKAASAIKKAAASAMARVHLHH
ncbi:hypothetical protein H4S06_002728 [Coemansia sp. BCRC 34490]|nr:hypothetical protein H4S06_002728 [Coemansia sp. BCRC 34490]